MMFKRPSGLRRHENVHLLISPNICPQCGKSFARKDALKRHFDTLTCRRKRSIYLGIIGTDKSSRHAIFRVVSLDSINLY